VGRITPTKESNLKNQSFPRCNIVAGYVMAAVLGALEWGRKNGGRMVEAVSN
jgi:hypothetical protein